MPSPICPHKEIHPAGLRGRGRAKNWEDSRRRTNPSPAHAQDTTFRRVLVVNTRGASGSRPSEAFSNWTVPEVSPLHFNFFSFEKAWKRPLLVFEPIPAAGSRKRARGSSGARATSSPGSAAAFQYIL